MTAFLFALALMFATPSSAQDGGRQIMSTDEAADWRAVGRLNIAGNRFCTASLISRDLILTAAHCLYHPETRAPVPLSLFRFVAGWSRGEYTALREISAAVALSGFSPGAEASYDSVGSDLALMRLQKPVSDAPFIPLSLSNPQGRDRKIVSYARSRPHMLSVRQSCGVGSTTKPGVIVLGCPIDHGESGAPVLALFDGELRIVAVVSAMAAAENGREFTLAVPVAQYIEKLVLGLSASDWPD